MKGYKMISKCKYITLCDKCHELLEVGPATGGPNYDSICVIASNKVYYHKKCYEEESEGR